MKSIFTASALVATTFAAVHEVTVGPGLYYSPDTITADKGDIISFTFGQGHNVVSGSFDSPCQPSGGIYSGDPEDGQVFSVTLNSTDPLWIYCSVPHHCESGMAMVVNPPSGRTLDDYKSAASSASGSSQPDHVEGGVFGAISAAASSAASTSSAAMTSSASMASASASSVSSSLSSEISSGSSVASSRASSASSVASSATATGNNAAITGAPAALLAAAGLVAFL